MKCLLVFDYSNDIIYTKYNKKFGNHINTYAKTQELISEEVFYSLFLSYNMIVLWESKEARLSVKTVYQI